MRDYILVCEVLPTLLTSNVVFACQEEYIKDEQRNLKKEYLHAQEEVKRIQSVPLVIGKTKFRFFVSPFLQHLMMIS